MTSSDRALARPGRAAREGPDWVASAIFAALVAACFAAFFVTQRLKHTPTLVQRFELTPSLDSHARGSRQRSRGSGPGLSPASRNRRHPAATTTYSGIRRFTVRPSADTGRRKGSASTASSGNARSSRRISSARGTTSSSAATPASTSPVLSVVAAGGAAPLTAAPG